MAGADARLGDRLRAERRLLTALRRVRRSSPLSPWIRTDALLGLLRSTEASDRRPPTHRGAAPLGLDDAQLRDVLAGLVADGRIERRGRRIRLAAPDAGLDPAMSRRVERLLAELRAAGASPPRVGTVARRLGVPPHVLEQLRRSGALVSVAPGIDYPADVWDVLRTRLAPVDELSARLVRDRAGVSRRYAEAIVERLRRDRVAGRDSRAVG